VTCILAGYPKRTLNLLKHDNLAGSKMAGSKMADFMEQQAKSAAALQV
jgi:hypothetical protein